MDNLKRLQLAEQLKDAFTRVEKNLREPIFRHVPKRHREAQKRFAKWMNDFLRKKTRAHREAVKVRDRILKKILVGSLDRAKATEIRGMIRELKKS